MKTEMNWIDQLKTLNPCVAALTWARRFPSFAAAWDACERGDWMLWLVAKKCDQKRVVVAACECARLALPHATGPEALVAIAAAERWTKGETSSDEVSAAAAAAASAAYAAYANAAHASYGSADAAALASANAALASAYAAYAAYAASAIDDASTVAAAASSYAAYAASPAAARRRTLEQCADIVRKHFTADEIDLRSGSEKLFPGCAGPS